MLTNPKNLLAVLAVALVFAGAGCYQKADQLASEAVSPVTVSADALNKAKETRESSLEAQRKALAAATDPVTVAFIVLEGHTTQPEVMLGEQFGCNDHVGYLSMPRSQDTGDDLKDALATLFAYHDTDIYEMYHVIGVSKLKLDKTEVKDGTTNVYITGEVVSGGTCDDPRIKKQIEATVAKYAPKYKIILNGKDANWRCLGNQSGQCK
jgi:hypothetical protein